jgi:hypothetical protein
VVSRSLRPYAIAAVWAMACVAMLAAVINAVQSVAGEAGPGFSFGTADRITNVVPGSAAERVGIRVGDRLIARQVTSRRFRVWFAHPGEPVRTSELTPACCSAKPNLTPFGVADALGTAIGTFGAILIAAWLFTVRPGTMTLALALATFTFASVIEIPALPEFSNRLLFVMSAFVTFNGFCPAFALFALRFPADEATGWRRWGERIVVAAILITQGILTLGLIEMLPAGLFFGSEAGGASFFVVSLNLGSAWMLVTLVILIVRYVSADPALRVKLRWAMVGFTIVLLYGAISFAGVAGLHQALFGIFDPLLALAPIALPASAAYALLRTRAIDPSFVINRAAVLGVAGAAIALVVGAADWLTRRELAGSNVSLAVNAGVSILLGYALATLRRRVEHGVDRVLFRHRYAAAEYVRRLGRSLFVARDPAVVERALVEDAPQAMSLASAALFLSAGEGEPYRRVRSFGWHAEHVTELPADDALVRFLRTEQVPLIAADARWEHHGVPAGAARPLLAVPLVSAGELAAFVLYGAHTNRSGIDIDEQQSLAQLCERGAVALAHIETLELRERLGAFLFAQ